MFAVNMFESCIGIGQYFLPDSFRCSNTVAFSKYMYVCDIDDPIVHEAQMI